MVTFIHLWKFKYNDDESQFYLQINNPINEYADTNISKLNNSRSFNSVEDRHTQKSYDKLFKLKILKFKEDALKRTEKAPAEKDSAPQSKLLSQRENLFKWGKGSLTPHYFASSNFGATSGRDHSGTIGFTKFMNLDESKILALRFEKKSIPVLNQFKTATPLNISTSDYYPNKKRELSISTDILCPSKGNSF